MQYCKHRLFNRLLALILLISSNSLALESLGHGHQQTHNQSMDIVETTVKVDTSNNHIHLMVQEPNHRMIDSLTESSNQTSHSHEDCICDDVCCVSTINFGSSSEQSTAIPSDRYGRLLPLFYQSISLDLLLPPPTF